MKLKSFAILISATFLSCVIPTANGTAITVYSDYIATQTQPSDEMSSLFRDFKDAITQQNQDMSYLLTRISQMAAINNAVSDYLSGLAGDTDALQAAIDEAQNQAAKDYLRFIVQNAQLRNIVFVPGYVDTASWDFQSLNEALAQRGGGLTLVPGAETTTSVAEPGTLALLGLGLIGLGVSRRRKAA